MVKDFFDNDIVKSVERLLFMFYTGTHQYYKKMRSLYNDGQRLKIENQLILFKRILRSEGDVSLDFSGYDKDVLEIFKEYFKSKQDEFLASPFALSEKIQKNVLNKAKSVLPLIQIVSYHKQFSNEDLQMYFL